MYASLFISLIKYHYLFVRVCGRLCLLLRTTMNLCFDHSPTPSCNSFLGGGIVPPSKSTHVKASVVHTHAHVPPQVTLN